MLGEPRSTDPGTAAPAHRRDEANETEVFAFDDFLALDTLHARFDAIAAGLETGDSSAAHRAVRHRLASNSIVAVSAGWTACSLVREGGGGRLRMVGIPPGATLQLPVPDRRPALVAVVAAVGARPPRSQLDASENQRRFNEIKAGIRRRVLPVCVDLSPNAFEQLLTRMTSIEFKYDDTFGAASAQGLALTARAAASEQRGTSDAAGSSDRGRTF